MSGISLMTAPSIPRPAPTRQSFTSILTRCESPPRSWRYEGWSVEGNGYSDLQHDPLSLIFT